MADGPASGNRRKEVTSRVPPHNLDAERSLLGAMMLRGDAIAAAVEQLTASSFYKPAHSHIYDAVTNLYSQGVNVDAVTVSEELRRAGLLEAVGGPAALSDLLDSTPSVSNASHYAKIVEENALLRKLISVAGDIAEMGYSLPNDVVAAIDQAESMVFEVAQRRVTDSTVALRDLLAGALDDIEKLYERGESITGLATGYNDLDELLSGLQPSTLNIIGARPAMGKCVAWDTPLIDPTTGAVRTAAEVWSLGSVGIDVGVATLTDAGVVEPATPSAFVDDGVKPTFGVRTELGRYVRTTASHPFLTEQGWRPLAQLAVGTRIAVPAALPFFGTEKILPAELAVIAYVLGSISFDEPDQTLDIALDRCRDLGVDVIETLQRHELWKVDPQSLRLPTSIWRIPEEQLTDFLERITVVNRSAQRDLSVWFATRSETLAREIVHLCLRVGNVMEITTSSRLRNGERVPLFELRRVARNDPRRADQPTEHVVWDRVAEIIDCGDDQVFDLTIDVTHNFVAADVFVHNTAFALGMATHIAVEKNRPVLFFSLEMGHAELTKRILASEARVDSQKMRTGKLTEADWSKISKAVGRLEAPLYIDDNPNLTIMEIRAKARRLKSRLGDLGVVIIDYLQLMTGRGSAENRQVEVSEMSRGLKILARELETPIIALSQLSRALELRADKRPMLADLRESGSIEQDADVVMFLYRDEVYHQDSQDTGTAEVIVSKHRSGPTGTKKLAFIANYTKFANIARGV
ncbi:MAG: replicative DNA helicase [Acidimicrobiia bacterium]